MGGAQDAMPKGTKKLPDAALRKPRGLRILPVSRRPTTAPMPASPPPPAPGTPPSQAEAGGVGEVFGAFLRLGLTSFGGPVAHLGYFRHEFVQRRRWLDDAAYAELVALCQFLPGPASSQTGMALGLARAGWAGMAAAWIAFTLPSALFMLAFALGLGQLDGLAASGALHGLKLAAVAVVAQAVWSMGRSLCPDRARQALALGAAIAALLLPAAWMQVGIMLACGLAGWRLLPALAAPAGTALAVGVGRRTGLCALLLFALLLAGLPLWAAASGSPPGSWPMASTAPARWCSAADTSCCPCCRPPWCPAARYRRPPSWPVMAPPRPYPARCSASPPSWARCCPPRWAAGPAHWPARH